MGGVHTEQGICLECHRSIDFAWRDEGQKVLGVGATHIVAVEQDGKDPKVRWLTLQAKCKCGATLGYMAEFSAAEDRTSPVPTGTDPAMRADASAPPPRGA